MSKKHGWMSPAMPHDLWSEYQLCERVSDLPASTVVTENSVLFECVLPTLVCGCGLCLPRATCREKKYNF